jgi:hypothetical protein
MSEVVTVQGTEEWKRLRRGRRRIAIGASEAGAAVGVSKYALPTALYEVIVTEMDTHSEDNPNFAVGHEGEPYLLDWYRRITGYVVKNGNYWRHADYPDYYGCTPDGQVYDDSGNMVGLVEAKTYVKCMFTEPKPEHIAQMQFQMWVTGMPWCDYFGCHFSSGIGIASCTPVLLIRFYRSDAYIDWMTERLREFTRCLKAKTPPEYGVPKRVPPVQSEDLSRLLTGLSETENHPVKETVKRKWDDAPEEDISRKNPGSRGERRA